MNKFGNRLRDLRKQSGLTIKQVSKKLGVAESTFRDWEQGRLIKGEPYVKISKLFNVSLYELMTGETGNLAPIFTKLNDVKSTIEHIEKDIGSLL